MFDLKQSIAPQVFTLKPVGDYQYRLVLDLYPKVAQDPLTALLRKQPGKLDDDPLARILEDIGRSPQGVGVASAPLLPAPVAPYVDAPATPGTSAATAPRLGGGGGLAFEPVDELTYTWESDAERLDSVGAAGSSPLRSIRATAAKIPARSARAARVKRMSCSRLPRN